MGKRNVRFCFLALYLPTSSVKVAAWTCPLHQALALNSKSAPPLVACLTETLCGVTIPWQADPDAFNHIHAGPCLSGYLLIFWSQAALTSLSPWRFLCRSQAAIFGLMHVPNPGDTCQGLRAVFQKHPFLCVMWLGTPSWSSQHLIILTANLLDPSPLFLNLVRKQPNPYKENHPMPLMKMQSPG